MGDKNDSISQPEAEDRVEGAEAPASEEPESGSQEQEVERLRRERDELEDRWRRALAELENTRKRFRREREEMRHYGHLELARDLLPVLDDLERALDGVPDERADDPLVTGLRLVRDQFLKVLRDHGVEPIEAHGRPFDPAHHEAIEHVERADVPPNTVVSEWHKGFRLRDRLLRAARVSVSRPPERPSDTDEGKDEDGGGPADAGPAAEGGGSQPQEGSSNDGGAKQR